MRRLGASDQLAIVGAYAWFVTVAPAAWAREAPVAAKVVATSGLLLLLVAPLVERRFAEQGRTLESGSPVHEVLRRRVRGLRNVSVWGLAATSGTVWLLAGAPGSTFDDVRGAFGMLGWALLAFAAAGPALEVIPSTAAPLPATHAARNLPSRSATGLIAVSGLIAAGVQVIGWRTESPEAAVLSRLVTVAVGLGLISLTARLAIVRRTAPAKVPVAEGRSRRRWLWGLVVGAALVLALLGARFVHGLYARSM
jgi:hypothetical protein